MMHSVIHGDCLEVMPELPENSVDSIVTDPPYGLSFMGKDWDYGVPGEHFWKEALRVAKPGAYLLAFGGTRTFHRLACAIEDAGWELRDTIMWVYGCLSEDTEVLTPQGWERYNTARHKEILVYDPEADIYQWEKPSRWSEYRVESDTAYRIESDQTNQIVSRNHRCLVEREGTLAFVAAEECAGVESVPYLQGDVSALSQSHGTLLLADLLRQGEGLAKATFCERQGQETSRHGAVWATKPSMERRTDVLQEEGQVRQSVDQVCSLSSGVRGYGSKGWLRDGASAVCGDGIGATAVAERVRTSQQPRCNGQPNRELDAVCDECGSQAARKRPSYRTTLATVTSFSYTGTVFCPTVSTGAFVARRNGMVFVTGNSGFPKSLDVSKAIDATITTGGSSMRLLRKRAMGECYEPHRLAGTDGFGVSRGGGFGADESRDRSKDRPVTTEAAQKWAGWGTALKPAWEPIIVARKPLEGTVAANVLRHGTGGMNIDGCRIELNGDYKCKANGRPSQTGLPDNYDPENANKPDTVGRWPANVIHDGSDEVVQLLPNTKSNFRVSKANGKSSIWGSGKSAKTTCADDSGSAARFFYCAKASKSDRDEGNEHPTVKPTDLMRYLCRLVTPLGGVILDPFTGSGSTGKAAILEGFDFIGIEKEEEYVKVANSRIDAIEEGLKENTDVDSEKNKKE